MIEVNVPRLMRKLTGGDTVIQAQAGTLGELFEALDRKHPGIRAELTDDDGGLRRFVNVYLNDEDVRFLHKLDTPLRDGDIVTILPALAGGR